jgi:hypothetical protein
VQAPDRGPRIVAPVDPGLVDIHGKQPGRRIVETVIATLAARLLPPRWLPSRIGGGVADQDDITLAGLGQIVEQRARCGRYPRHLLMP